VPDLAAARVPLAHFAAIVLLTAAVAAFLGNRLPLYAPSGTEDPVRAQAVDAAEGPELPGRGGFGTRANVGALTVNLRGGPGLEFPIVARLHQGDAIGIRNDQGSWWSVSTTYGASGYVFAGLLTGVGDEARSPAIVRQTLVAGDAWHRVVLRPGQRVLRVTDPDGRINAVLPDGHKVAVGEGVLVDVR